MTVSPHIVGASAFDETTPLSESATDDIAVVMHDPVITESNHTEVTTSRRTERTSA